jgi:putative PEP-CTERM system TPR-repeat lipoprotein
MHCALFGPGAVRFALMLSLVWILLPAAAARADGTAIGQTVLQTGLDLRRAGELKEALVLLKNHVTAQPGDIDARLLLVQVQMDLLQGDDAEQELRRLQLAGAPRDRILVPLLRALLQQESYQQVLTEASRDAYTDPEGGALLLALTGMARLGLLEYQAAEADFDEARRLIPGQLDALLGQARLALALGDRPAARERLVEATTAHPESAAAWIALADLDHARGALAQAEQSLVKARVAAFNKWVPRFKRALVRIELGRLDAAEAELDAIEAELPAFPALHFGRGMLLLARGDVHLGIESVQEYLRYDPGNVDAILALARAEIARGNDADAEALLRRGLRVRPNAEDILLGLARLLLRREDADGAEALLRPPAQAGAATPAMLAVLAQASTAADRPRDAWYWLQRAIAAEPGNTAHRIAAADLLMTLGEPESALAQLDQAVTLDPLHRTAPLLRIKVLLAANRHREALTQALALARLRRDDPDVRNALGLVQLGMGKPGAAAEAFAEALAIEPGHQDAAWNLFSLHMRDGDRDLAREVLEALVEARPTANDALLALADLEGQAQGSAARLRRLRLALDTRPDDLELRLALARAHRDAGAPLRARAVLGAAPEQQLNAPALAKLLGESQLAANDVGLAIKTFSDLRLLRPDDASVHDLLASAYARAGRMQDMEDSLVQALVIDADDPSRLRAVDAALATLPDLAARLALLERIGGPNRRPPWLLDRRADLLFQAGDLGAALPLLEEVQQAKPDDLGLLRKRLAVHGRRGDTGSVLGLLQDWVRRRPADAGARIMLAQAMAEHGDRDGARDLLEQVYEEQPGNPVVLNNLAWLLRDSDPARALNYAEQANRLFPGDPALMDTLGALLLGRDELERALALLEQAHEAAPANPGIALNYAEALSRAGRNGDARVLLAELSGRSFPGSDRARALLADLNDSAGPSTETAARTTEPSQR